MSHPDLCRDPIFILGILMRTGTNFLYDLVRLHLDCDVPTPVPEDYLVHCADLLAEYVGSLLLRIGGPIGGSKLIRTYFLNQTLREGYIL